MEKRILDTAMSGRKSSRGLRAALSATLLLALLGAVAGQAADGHDHDRARRALESGEIVPLRAILERVARDYPGQIMEVELEREAARWIYEITLLRTGGALVEIEIDARDGKLLGIKGPKGKDGRRGAAR
jgi:uncharacterized membrane protein YkoI